MLAPSPIVDPFADLACGTYRVVTADPPWHFRARTALQTRNFQCARGAEKRYATMGLDDIMAMPVSRLAAKDAHLFLWTTGPCLPQAFEVIKAWGFRYSSIAFTWVKLKRSHNALQLRVLPLGATDLHTGLGLTTRKNAEFCLLARRGNCRRESKSVREIILSPVREHSRKPDEFYDRVQQYAVGPYVELFARQSRPGWTTWGNESTKFDKPYDAQADLGGSIALGLQTIRERVAAGGEGWGK